jgi:hypothetical protein
MLAFPDLWPAVDAGLAWDGRAPRTAEEGLAAAGVLSGLHLRALVEVLGLLPDVIIALPGGETAASALVGPSRGTAWRRRGDLWAPLGELPFDVAVRGAADAGARTFVLAGTSGDAAATVSDAVGLRPHGVVVLERRGDDALERLFGGVAALYAAGHAVDVDALERRLPVPRAAATGRMRTFEAHAPAVSWARIREAAGDAGPRPEDVMVGKNGAEVTTLPRAPWLPPVMDEARAVDGASILGGGAPPKIVRLPEDPAWTPAAVRAVTSEMLSGNLC